MAEKYLNNTGLETVWNKIKSIFGMPEPLYEEVEWVESTGKQYVYLDWKPPIETWGFEADFIIKNKFNTTQAAWNSFTNTDNSGMLFGVRSSSGVNDIELGTYGSTGYFRAGGGTIPCGIKTDKTRQTIKLIGTTLTKPDGTTATIQRSAETTNKPYHNMAIFAYYDGLRRSSYGGLNYPSTSRIYSLKFYEGETVKVHLVGAIRKSDNTTGLYDKISNHFYPAPAMNHGEVVGNLGQRNTILNTAQQGITCAMADNREAGRLWKINLSNIKALEDGQQISVMPLYSVPSSIQTTELKGWDDTGSSSYVYLKATLADGTETDWIPCYYQQTTRLTNHYGSNQAILFTYRENVIIAANATTAGYMIVRGFFGDVNYNTDRLYDCFSDSVVAGRNGAKRYTLCMQDDEGNWTSIVNQANNTGATGKTCYTSGLKLGKILYHATGSDYGAGANSGAMYQTYLVDARYSTNGITSSASTTTLQLRKPFYLVGTLGNDGLFYLDELQWWTQIEPISEDGKVYILVGWAYSSYYYIYLAANNPAYVYKNGKFRPLMDIYTIEADVPSDAKFTDTTYSAGTGISLSGTTFSNSGVTGVKGNSESSYRTGQVNLTSANIGAVATTGNETIAGNKTFSGTTTLSVNSIYPTTDGTVIAGSPTTIIQSPIPKYLWHDIWAFNRCATPTYETYNGTTWTETNLQTNLFIHKENWGSSTILNSSINGSRWTWINGGFYASMASWLVLGVTYQSTPAHFDVLLETSSDSGSTWTTLVNATDLYYSQVPIWIRNTKGTQASLRLTITKNSSSADNAVLGLCSIRFLTSRWGDQGKGSELEYPYQWDASFNIYPLENNTSTLGTSSYKWNNVYATTVSTATVNATNKVATPIVETGSTAQSYFQTERLRGQGNADAYYHAIDFGKSNHNQVDFYEYGGVFNFHKHTGATIDTGDTLLGTINNKGWDGKVNNHTINADVPADAVFTDTVTTATTTGDGNAVTSITASNGALTVTKGTTFLTSHQDISGKADKSATVSTVSYDSTNKKITKTINGTTSDVVTAATLKTAMGLDNAEANQNAFSNVKIGSTTVSADSKTDTLELAAGSNITLTPDATNDKITIAATDTTYESKAAAEDGTALSLVTTGEKYLWNSTASSAGTVTSVQVQATSPVVSSTNTAQSTSLNTTISLANNYGDTKNPYGSKTKNTVLAAPSAENGTPSFRALVASDIPNLSWNKITSDKPTTLNGYGITDAMAGSTNVNNVAQTATTTSNNYELLFSGTADNTTRNEGTRKTSTLTYNPSTKALVTGGTVNGYTLAAASAKGVDTSISENSTSTNLPTSAAVANLVSSAIATSDAMVFKGTLGTDGTITALPTTYKTGWTYRVITAGTYAGNVCEIGDLIIALIDRNGSGNLNSDWTVAQTNVDGALTTAGGVVNGILDVQNEFSANSATVGNMIVNGNAVFTNGLTGDVTGNVSGSAGSVAWSNVSGKPTETEESTTGISIGNHATGTVIGVQSSTTSVIGVQSGTTTASKVTLGTALSIPNVTGASDVTVPKAATSATTVPIKNTTATSIPNVTNVGSASNWVFENITVPIKASSATTVPIAASSATTVPIKDASATTIPNVTDAGSGSASLTFTMDSTDTKKLIISFSHTHTPPTIGTPISVTGVQSTTTSVTGVNGSTSVTGVQSSTTTASHVKSGGNGTAPTLGTAISIYGVQSSTTSVTGVSGSTTASKVTLGTAIDVPNVTNVNDVTVPIKATSATTVPIKNTSASTFVTGTTHTITDNGHTHSIN